MVFAIYSITKFTIQPFDELNKNNGLKLQTEFDEYPQDILTLVQKLVSKIHDPARLVVRDSDLQKRKEEIQLLIN
jgi:hypothetical protein